MKRVKTSLALLLAVIMLAALLAGCSGGGASNNASSPSPAENTGNQVIDEQGEVDDTRPTTANSDERYDTITLAISSDPQDLNPWNISAGGKKYTCLYFYESLFDYDQSNYYPVLAKGYTEVDDLHWDVEIYDYIKDSAGNPITADDVVFSYNVIRESGYLNHADMLESVEKVDDYTVRFTWNKKIDGVCELEWVFGMVKIFSQSAYENGNFATAPITTGPYVVQSFVAGSGMTLVRNENYWQEDDLIARGHHAYVDTIEVKLISEYAQQVIGLQNGTIDFSYSIPAENLEDFQEGGKYGDDYNVYLAPLNGYFYIEGNMSEKSIWSDKNFRLAVFYGLNNDAIATATSLPAATTLGTPLWNEFYDAWSQNETYINTYDPELAKQYLEQSGYDGSQLTLICANDEQFKNACIMVQTLLKQIGIDVYVETMEQTQMETLIGGDTGYDMFLMGGGGSSLIGGLNRMLNNSDFANGCAPGMLYDETLFEKYAYVSQAENYTLENMTDFMDYVFENAYIYCPVYRVNTLVFTSDIAELGLGYNCEFILGDSVYYLD